MKTLPHLIKSLKLNYVNPNITEANFPDDGRRGKVEIIDFNREPTSEKALKEMNGKGYRPATAYELLEWAKDNWNGKDWVVALGQTWRGPGGGLRVLFLWGNAGDRGLDLGWFGPRWPRVCRFAFVRKDSRELEPRKGENLDASDKELLLKAIEGVEKAVKEFRGVFERLKNV